MISSEVQKAVGIAMLAVFFGTILLVLPFLWECYNPVTGSFHFTLEAAVGAIMLGAGGMVLAGLFVVYVSLALRLIMR